MFTKIGKSYLFLNLTDTNDIAKLIVKFSNTQVIVIENNHDIEKYFKKNLTKNEIIIGMGAGFISKFMRGLITFL